MSSRVRNSEQLRMPVQKGLFFRPIRSKEAFIVRRNRRGS
jgi:hypothetical protein